MYDDDDNNIMAIHWYKLAADQGNVDAQYKLSSIDPTYKPIYIKSSKPKDEKHKDKKYKDFNKLYIKKELGEWNN